MFFSVLLHRFGSLAPYCIWGAFLPEFTGFFFHLLAVQSPSGSATSGGKWAKREKKQNKTRKGITVVHVSTPSLFVRVREHHLLLDCAVYFYITHTSGFVFRLSGIFCLFTPAGQTGVSGFCFPARLISITVCVRTEKKHSKADKRKKKSQRGVEVTQPQQIKT